MIIKWSKHARERFWERFLKLGITESEVEWNVRLQEIRWNQPNQKTIKTVFSLGNFMLTVVKEETDQLIMIVSVWESDAEEVEEWIQKRQNASAGERGSSNSKM